MFVVVLLHIGMPHSSTFEILQSDSSGCIGLTLAELRSARIHDSGPLNPSEVEIASAFVAVLGAPKALTDGDSVGDYMDPAHLHRESVIVMMLGRVPGSAIHQSKYMTQARPPVEAVYVIDLVWQ
jgi:hypothetical protein